MSTLVSAFISNVNGRYNDTLTLYYNFGKLLLKSNSPKIIFVDEPMFDLIGDEYDKSNTVIIKIISTDIYLYDYNSNLSNFVVNSTNHSKDTKEFMFTICNKTEWIKEAILLNYFGTTDFIWVDFGIRHVFKCSDEEFIEKLNKLKYKTYNGVRIGSIWNLDMIYNIDIYKDIMWYFAGGVFGGNANFLLRFSELMKDKCVDIITKSNTIMWEVNIWYLIYIETKEIFDIYNCNHDNTIIDNY